MLNNTIAGLLNTHLNAELSYAFLSLAFRACFGELGMYGELSTL